MITNVGIVVPARNEQDGILDCLDAIDVSRRHLGFARPDLRTRLVVVLDSCTDATASLIHGRADTEVVVVDHASVGAARAAGTARLVAGWPHRELWLANTDADSLVPRHWLSTMLDHAEAGADLVLGTVRPDDRLDHRLRRVWDSHHTFTDGHPHVHGANFGIRLGAYRALGGWSATRTGEDVELAGRAVGRFVVHRAADLAVTTSSRATGRAPHGFADYLRALDAPDDLAPTA